MSKRLIMQIALPVFIESALMMADSIIHVIWVGHLLGGLAVAAIGACFPIILAFAAIAGGAARVATTPILQHFQAKNKEKMQTYVNLSWSFGVCLVVIMTAGGYFSSRSLLALFGTPESVIGLAGGYLRIMMLGFAVMYLSFLTVSMLRGVGNVVARMLFVAVSIVGNLVLVPLFIEGTGPFPKWGLNGVAIAALIVSVIAIIVSLWYIRRRVKGLLTRPTGWKFNGKLMAAFLPAGMPVFMQQLMLALGYACILFFVNPFGSDAIAVFYVTSRIDSIAAMPSIAVMIAISVLTGKTLQAGRFSEIPNLFRRGLIVNLPVVLLISLLCFFAPHFIMELFINDPNIVSIGIGYFRIVSLSYLLFSVLYVCNGIITGVGKSGIITLFSLASLVVVRVPAAAFLTQAGFKVNGVWLAILASFVALAACSLFYYLFGSWKKGWKMTVMESSGMKS
ncbi:MATE family efflux transporter [Thermoactinomyces sp. CICC 10523]|uniref:MATE family efflux transporter n=1 Tax=Thermoactinomyces sp. CICC 10523 TaxID=2767428 RepID=UPI0018DB1C03|nr:MATE family efflux transporter [Thermoactinomyces sp. CICC 10523]